MGACIEAVATAWSHRGLFGRGGLRLSDAAARDCLERAHYRAEELDLLISAGLYKDKSLAEPALASIIQEDIGANPGHPPVRGRHGTFSFDVLNGGCGVLTALQLVNAFVAPGTARVGLIVAGDADPGGAHDFPFPSVGGALLLAHADGAAGFERFAFRTFAEDAGLFEVRVEWEPERERNAVRVHEDPRFAGRCLDHAVELVGQLWSRKERAEVDLLVASQYPLHFADQLARALEIADDRVPRVPGPLAGTHTAGPLAALEAAMGDGRFAAARQLLLVTVGAGITVGAAHYRKEPV